MSNWRRERIDPIAYLSQLGITVDHITYDPKMRKGDFSVIRQSAHDGTYTFTYELIAKTLQGVVNKLSYYKLRKRSSTQQRTFGTSSGSCV